MHEEDGVGAQFPHPGLGVCLCKVVSGLERVRPEVGDLADELIGLLGGGKRCRKKAEQDETALV